ncbi:MAG: hypothetical protein IPK79_12430 [Vampirovibrionales bacterium]|nr:hypothetical protein [Vampirovibrionales bacterium]
MSITTDAQRRNTDRARAAIIGLSLFAALSLCPGVARAGDVSGGGQAPGGSAQSDGAPLRINSSSEKVPEGTALTIAFTSTLDSRISQVGEPFTAVLKDDFTALDGDGVPRVILPKQTAVRGRLAEVKRPGLFSRGGSILLGFDHVALPSGELLPLDLNLSAQNDTVRRAGDPNSPTYALYSDPGVGAKLRKSVGAGAAVYDHLKQAGIDRGKNVAGGLGMAVTVPAGILGGAVAGTAVTTGKGVMAVIGRGDSMKIQPGDTVKIDFGGAFTLPSQ